MTGTKKINTIIATFVIIILALALTPAIAAFVEDSRYSMVTHTIPYGTPLAATVNTTTTDYNIRNVTSTFIVDIKDATANVSVTVVPGTDFIASAAKQFKFIDVFDNSLEYWGTIGYQTVDLTPAAVLALIAIIPILWVTIVLAVGIVAIKLQLDKRG